MKEAQAQQIRLDALSRRNFLKRGAGTGLVLGTGPLLSACFGGGGDGPPDSPPATGTEKRTYYFNLANAHPQADHYLVAGTKHHPLKVVDAAARAQARQANPAWAQVSDANLTHVGAALDMPAGSIQVCYVKSVPRDGSAWHMHSMLYHVPQAATAQVARGFARQSQACSQTPPPSCRAAFLSAAQGGALPQADTPDQCNDPDFADYKDYFDHAVALVLNHPEICSFDAATLAYVHTLVCAEPTLLDLAVSLFRQGPATTAGGWATQVPLVDPDTGKPMLASDGSQQYYTQHSQATLQATGVVIRNVLPKVKNDPLLGANITGLSRDTVNTGLQGKLWSVRDGTPTRRPAGAAQATARLAAAGQPPASASTSFAALDVSTGPGFCFSGISGDATARTVTFTAENWYLRFLGLYVRFLDAAGKPLPVSGLDSTTAGQFPAPDLSGTYDNYVGIMNQELVILGIPYQQASTSHTIQLPASAASVRLLAGGLGMGDNPYPDTLKPGVAMTAVLDLALPGLFLAMSATQGFGLLSKAVAGLASGPLNNVVQTAILAFTDLALNAEYGDPALFKNIAVKLATALVVTGGALADLVLANLRAGEAIGATEDAIPFGIGLIIQAIGALAVVAQLAETSTEVGLSPRTYVTDVVLTHDLTVTVLPDPLDTLGFPATATHWQATAVFDGGAPYHSDLIPLSANNGTAPLQYVFTGMPAGGRVDVTVQLTAPGGWLAGAGIAAGVDNTQDAASVTIIERLVPLTASTRYGHQRKSALDDTGNHVWQLTSQVPAAQAPSTGNTAGSLQGLTGITFSQPFAAVRYSWQAYSAAVTSFGNNTQGQLYQFASLSLVQDAQQSYPYLFSGQGFASPVRLAYARGGRADQNYYIDSASGGFIVRRVNLSSGATAPTFDGPASGRAVGRFNFASDAFLIHPTGKLISINAALHKMEVIALPANPPVGDADAPRAQMLSGPGTRDGLLGGPVCAAVRLDGAILVLEQANNRIQAFDIGGNPVPVFGSAGSLAPTMALYLPAGAVPTYLDLAVESTGYVYVLSQDAQSAAYALDIYSPQGQWVSRTTGVNARKLAVDLFRNVFTLNMETLQPAARVTEPSVSQWVPSTP